VLWQHVFQIVVCVLSALQRAIRTLQGTLHAEIFVECRTGVYFTSIYLAFHKSSGLKQIFLNSGS
jgi:hypothetical protein